MVRLQGVLMRELRVLIAERRTASIRHAHSVEVVAPPPGAQGWALGGPRAVSGTPGEDAGNHLRASLVSMCWDAPHRARIPGTPQSGGWRHQSRTLKGTQTSTRL